MPLLTSVRSYSGFDGFLILFASLFRQMAPAPVGIEIVTLSKVTCAAHTKYENYRHTTYI